MPGTGLKFVTIKDASIVPRHLLESVAGRDWDVDAFYTWAPLFLASPLTMMGVFMNGKEKPRGFLWVAANPLDNKIHVQVLSVDKGYRGKGIIPETRGILKKIQKQFGLKGILFRTTIPEIFERHGFKRSETVIMED